MASAVDEHAALKVALQAFSARLDKFVLAPWLKSDFADLVWQCDFEKAKPMQIDFRVKLADGHCLTSPKHCDLLHIFKHWIIAHTTVDYETRKRRRCQSSRMYHLFCDVLQIIDLILIKGETLRIHEHGLSALTQSEVRQILRRLASSNKRAKSVYSWELTLSEFLRGKIQGGELQLAPEMLWIVDDIPPVDERMTDLSEEEIGLSRVWLWQNGFYKAGTDKRDDVEHYKYTIRTVALSRLVYANTLRGHAAKFQIVEFKLKPLVKIKREMRAINVRNSDNEGLLEKKLTSLLNAMRSLILPAELGMPVSPLALNVIAERRFLDSLVVAQPGRFLTLPTKVAMYGLKKAIELILRDGEDIIARATSHISFFLSMKQDVNDRRFSRWSVKANLPKNEKICAGPKSSNFVHQSIRDGHGLYELMVILYGAVITSVGFLMARRQDEMMKLMPGKCWTKKTQGFYLNFENGKSGVNGVHEILSRPMPDVAMYGIGLLEKFQKSMLTLGVIDESMPIFSIPTLRSPGMRKASVASFNMALDYFCDYVEMPCNGEKYRYYIRAHQQRRFFALLFYWGADGSLDTLRWFLGHTDLKHVYHYITESTPGEILREAKAQYVQEKVQQDKDALPELGELLFHRFGTHEFSILDANDLDEYISQLIDSGMVTVEPEFFQTPEGERHRIAVTVHERRQSGCENRGKKIS